MALDRGTLSRIDRRVLSELDHGDGVRLVKVPLSKAVWSAWRRYCAAIGVTMGAGVAGLIAHELCSIVGELADADVPLFGGQREEKLAARESRVAARERDLAETEERIRGWTRRLGTWERQLHARERPLDLASKPLIEAKPNERKVGRNERCPCGSGLKFKLCHGFAGRQR